MLQRILKKHSDHLGKLAVAAILLASALLANWTVGGVAAQIARAQEKPAVENEMPRYAELPNFHRVNDRLYRGGQPREGGIKKLAALGVNTIINLRAADEQAGREETQARAMGLRYFNIPLERLGRPTDEQINQVLAIINAPENGRVFVHCAKGQDRTGTVIAIYRIKHDRWTSEEAKREAVRYGMKFWQRGMKDYINDYYRDHVKRAGAGTQAKLRRQERAVLLSAGAADEEGG